MPTQVLPAPAQVPLSTWLVLDLSSGRTQGFDYSLGQAMRVFNTPMYKTMKMAFRLVPKGRYYVQNSTEKTAEMERDFYIALFELTKAQYKRILAPSQVFSSDEAAELLPCVNVPWRLLRGTDKGPVAAVLGKHVFWDYKQKTGVEFTDAMYADSIRFELGDPSVKVRRISGDRSDTEKAKAFEDWKVVLRDQRRHRIDGFEEFETDRTPGGTWHNLYRNLYGVLSGTEELIVKPEQVLACMKVIDAAFRSSREGITVRL